MSSNVPMTQTECADKLGISLIEFKHLGKRVEGRSLETDLINPEDFERYKKVYESEKAKPAKPAMQLVKPELSHDNSVQTHDNLNPNDLYKQAYQAGVNKARMAFAIQTKAFQTHLDALVKGEIAIDGDVNPDELAREIAQIEQSLSMGN